MYISIFLSFRMAAKLEGLLECRKCHTSQNKPVKYLGCLHIFCTDCIRDMVTPESFVRCDRCKARTQLNQSGVDGLPDCKVARYGQLIQMLNEEKSDTFCHSCKSNSRPPTLYCFDCQFFLCEQCHLKSHKLFQAGHVKVLNVSDLKGRNADDILEKVGFPECSQHQNHIATQFDTNYNIPICDFHTDSDFEDVEPIGSVVKERLETIREKMAKSLQVAEVMKSRLNDLTDLKITISKDETENLDSTNEYFDKLISCLESRRVEVLKEIRSKSEPTHRMVTNEMEKQEKTIEKYYDAQEFIKINLEFLPKNFLLTDFDAIDWYLRHFNENIGVKTATLKDCHALDIPQFLPDESLEELLSKTGKVEGGKQELTPKRAPKVFSKPKIPSRSGTPRDLQVPLTPPKVKERKKRATVIKLTDTSNTSIDPYEIAYDANQYFILDRNSNIIHVSDTNGHICDTLTLHHFHGKSTWGLAVGCERVLVSDIFYKHVVMLDKKGQVISILYKTDTKDFGHPTGLAVNGFAKCVGVVDNMYKKVHIFTLTPHYMRSLGGDWLRNPTAICVDNHGDFVVLDSSDVLKFVVLNKSQNFVKHIYPPFEEIAIGVPENISVSVDGRLCWSDSSTHSIVVVREDGGLLEVLGGGKEGVSFKCPTGVCFDVRGKIVVCDSMNKCLVVL